MARNRFNIDIEDDDETDGPPPVPCWLCGRDMGEVVEWHHPTPKSKGGRDKVPVHAICHKTVHNNFTNAELSRMGDDLDAIRGNDVVAKFLDWIADKDPDFYVPTYKEGGKGGKRR